MNTFTGNVIEDATRAWLEVVGWSVLHGPDIAPESSGAEWENHDPMLLPKFISGVLRVKDAERFVEAAV